MPIQSVASHSLLPDVVRKGGIVIDCGANLGAFSKVMLQTFKCRVFAYEASPEVFARLPHLPGLTAMNVAVCGVDGPVSLAVDADITRTAIGRGNSVTIEVPGRVLGGLIAEAGVVGEIEVLKLDIEGAELAVLDSLPDALIQRIGQITIEFHDFLGYHPTAEVERRIQRILALGFRELYWSKRRNTGDVLLVNNQRLSVLRHFVEQSVVRPIRAVGRKLDRTRRWSRIT